MLRPALVNAPLIGSGIRISPELAQPCVLRPGTLDGLLTGARRVIHGP